MSANDFKFIGSTVSYENSWTKRSCLAINLHGNFDLLYFDKSGQLPNQFGDHVCEVWDWD